MNLKLLYLPDSPCRTPHDTYFDIKDKSMCLDYDISIWYLKDFTMNSFVAVHINSLRIEKLSLRNK